MSASSGFTPLSQGDVFDALARIVELNEKDPSSHVVLSDHEYRSLCFYLTQDTIPAENSDDAAITLYAFQAVARGDALNDAQFHIIDVYCHGVLAQMMVAYAIGQDVDFDLALIACIHNKNASMWRGESAFSDVPLDVSSVVLDIDIYSDESLDSFAGWESDDDDDAFTWDDDDDAQFNAQFSGPMYDVDDVDNDDDDEWPDGNAYPW